MHCVLRSVLTSVVVVVDALFFLTNTEQILYLSPCS